MTTYFDFSLTVWIRLASSATKAMLLEDLREHLELEYVVSGLDPIDNDTDSDSFHSFMLQLQSVFIESEMDDGDPTETAIDELDIELTAYIEREFRVHYLEILDDALTSVLLAERDEP